MSRSSSPSLLFDPEIEKTARWRRKEARRRRLVGGKPAEKGETSVPIAQLKELGGPEVEEGIQERGEPEKRLEVEVESEEGMADEENDPRLCDLTSHDASDPDSPIKLPEGTPSIEIKLPLLSVLPKFYGKPGADPYDFLNEFTRLCSIQRRPAGMSEETFRLAVFSFTLSGEANAWFRRLPPRSLTTWTELKTAFLEYYFSSTKTTALKKAITSIRQEMDESLSEY